MAPTDHGGGGTGTALVPSQERPSFTADELAHVQPLADVDSDILRSARRSVELGVYTIEQAKARFNLSNEEAAELSKPVRKPSKPSALKAIDEELAEIQALRKTNRRLYWSDETQAREAELIAKRERLKAMPAAAREDASDAALPAELQQRWQRQPGGVEGALDAIRRRTVIAFEGADQEDIEDLKKAFDTDLSEDIQVEVADALAQDSGKRQKASEQTIADFKATEHGAELVREWGDKAPALLGAARQEAAYIMGQLTETSRLKLNRWIDTRPTAHKESIIKLLIARAARRTVVNASGRAG